MGRCMKKVENYCPKGYSYSILRTTHLCNKNLLRPCIVLLKNGTNGRWKFGLQPRYVYCYTLYVNCWIDNKEGQGPRRNFDARFSLSYGKNICFLDIA